MSKVFITCALPYANGPTHLGHLRSTYIPADIYARYRRLRGDDVLFVCATDEHGTPIAVKAEREGLEPIEVATEYHEMIKRDLEECDISFDSFTRTTDDLHYEIAQNFFLKLYEKGYIYEKDIKQLYCNSCERFLPDRYVEGTCPHCGGEGARGDHCESCGRHLEPLQLEDPLCMVCGSEPVVRDSRHYFFRLSQFQDKLRGWIEESDMPSNVKNYALQWLREGLRDWILTRDMDWGVPVPLEGNDGKIIYVWGEAFLGYISSAAAWSRRSGKPWREYWDAGAVHFIGKDIIYHHAIFWPALLMAYGCRTPENIIAGEYLSLEGRKMSTSKNWVVWTSDFLERFHKDLLRYYLTVNAPLTRDTDFSWDDFQRRVNDELADVLGNFLHRTFSFTGRFFDGRVPEPSELTAEDEEFLNSIKRAPDTVGELLENFQFRDALMAVIKLAKKGNKYFNDQEPWKAIKESPERASTCLYLCNLLAANLGKLLMPFMPSSAGRVLSIMNMEDEPWGFHELEAGRVIERAKPLFSKIPDEVIEEEKSKLIKEEDSVSETVTIDDFAALDIRVGIIRSAERIEGSDKLLKLIIDVGEREMQVVAGLAEKYSPDDLLERKVTVLTNLKPAKLFGVKSEGMVLATGESLNLLDPGDAGIGERIM
ncbi:methionine--tRNA ligase [Methanothermobacter sp.]|uniref:methionine--tRNA ligase n=1 Tax=Methanothermobacter sp. TaxID=1884223 RepID=UPI0026048B8C|nr:methionine--tRNA ligase [Methanothermobacter sp.]MDI9617460.1 methionine--tRNA ligase [Methanothermobacter sp.]